MTKRSGKKQVVIISLIGCICCLGMLAVLLYMASLYQYTQKTFGYADVGLGFIEKIELSFRLAVNRDNLLLPIYGSSENKSFTIQPDETVQSIAQRLQRDGFIFDSQIFLDYLLYKGYDRSIQTGEFLILPGLSAQQIAERIHSQVGDMSTFTILPGWRAEEVASALSTYSFMFSSEDFLDVVNNPGKFPTITGKFSQYSSLEGYLAPGIYKVNNQMELGLLINMILDRFDTSITQNLLKKYQKQGMNLEQALVLASMVEKEMILPEEAGLIASVFYNRLAAGMKLESDPTVQYSIGYDHSTQTWWKNPLSINDLQINSAYNTYQNYGLPPAPICNPSVTALKAVANPVETQYYYFRAACDGSGKHNFSITFEEHKLNGCDR